jgi:N6-L-threonylcarbamoyladenine synthase
MVVSGGHTLFVDVNGVGDYRLLGRSMDDAAGEAFDKVGKMLDLPYPGGPEIDRLAEEGDPKAFDFPRGLIKEASANVSFSGLKTAVLYTLPKLTASGNPHDLPEQTLRDLCASFRQAVVDVLVRKALFALKESGRNILSVSGGVSCNKSLRTALKQTCDKKGIELILPDFDLTTDNATMIAYVAGLKAKKGLFHDLSEDVDPNLKLTNASNRSKGNHH